MILEEGNIYHIYNRSNNNIKVFYSRDNYLFFLDKFHHHINPYCSILAWCLMPTHFHLMVQVNRLKINNRKEDLNASVGKMLSSYTRAIQKKEGFKGSIFQNHTKAKCLNNNNELVPSYWNTEFGSVMNIDMENHNYPLVCFNYIHMNPVSDKLVISPEDWEFSSYRDYYRNRKGKLIDYELARDELLF